jgi:catechol 2,3-dioxygenase-like lactoylglutathione lyase family enzyme
MRLAHLGLLVADQDRSLQFYETYFGFDPGTAKRYPDGTVIVKDAHGFALALHAGVLDGPLPPFLHFGFEQPDPGTVRDMLARVRADGVDVIEYDEEPELVTFKCLDPDGYHVEAYWEP